MPIPFLRSMAILEDDAPCMVPTITESKVKTPMLSPKGLLGDPSFTMYGDSVMREFTRTNLIQLTLFSLSFVMMSGLGSQASRMLLTTQ